MRSGVATPASANQPSASDGVTSRVPPSELVELDARDELAVARAHLVGVGRQVPVEGDQPATRPQGAQRGSQGADGIGQLVEGVLEVGERRLAIVADGGDVAVLDVDRGPRGPPPPRPPGRGRRSPPRTPRRSAVVPGKRRAIATSQRPPPQWTSRIRAPGARSTTSCGIVGRTSWKNTAMSWTVSRSIAVAVAVGPRRERGRRSGRHPRRSAKSRLPMAAWRNCPPRYSGRSASSRMVATSSSTRRRPSSSSTRSCAAAPQAQRATRAGSVPVRRASSSAVSPAGSGVAQPRQQPELEAREHVPRAVEAAEAGDQVVEAVVEEHWRIVARADRRAGRVPAGIRTVGSGC